jgi:hypothetical protein
VVSQALPVRNDGDDRAVIGGGITIAIIRTQRDPPLAPTKQYELPSKGPIPAARLKSYTGPPMTLGNAAAARVRLIVWCRDCRHKVEPDPAEMVERYGAATTVPDWHERLRCSQCGSLNIDMVVSGTERR